MAVLLHIGGPKCGSSAIQAALCQAGEMRDRQGRAVSYAVIHQDGDQAYLLHGVRLRRLLRRLRKDGLATMGRKFHLLSEVARQQISDELKRLGGRADQLVILSFEGWIHNSNHLHHYILPLLPEAPSTDLIIRPQLDFLNAAWWQWGAWAGGTLPEFLKQYHRSADWDYQISRFMNVTGLEAPHISLYGPNIVADFAERHGIILPDPGRINQTLPPVMLRLMQRNKEKFRPGPHHNAFWQRVSRAGLMQEGGPFVGARSPWVIPYEETRRLLGEYRDANARLLARLPEHDQIKMRENERWWSAKAYFDQEVQPWEPCLPSAEELEELALWLAERIDYLEGKGAYRHGAHWQALHAYCEPLIQRWPAKSRKFVKTLFRIIPELRVREWLSR